MYQWKDQEKESPDHRLPEWAGVSQRSMQGFQLPGPYSQTRAAQVRVAMDSAENGQSPGPGAA